MTSLEEYFDLLFLGYPYERRRLLNEGNSWGMKGTPFSNATMFMMVTEAAATAAHGDGAAVVAAKANSRGSDLLMIREGNTASESRPLVFRFLRFVISFPRSFSLPLNFHGHFVMDPLV